MQIMELSMTLILMEDNGVVVRNVKLMAMIIYIQYKKTYNIPDIAAPICGWGRFETFEFGCTVAFHDRSAVIRSYVVVMLLAVFLFPLGKYIGKIKFYTTKFLRQRSKIVFFVLRSQSSQRTLWPNKAYTVSCFEEMQCRDRF